MPGLRTLLTYLAIAGNILFVLWMAFNGMDEGWRATPFQLMSYIGLTLLLTLNTYLLLRREKPA
jgi:hypothetical protein